MVTFDVGTAEKPVTLHILTELGEGAVGTDHQDIFTHLRGQSQIDGREGADRAIMAGTREEYASSISYGKFQNLYAYIAENQYKDVEIFEFTNGVLRADFEGNAGVAYKLYQAAFDRKPDAPGLKHQIEALDNGAGYLEISKNFVESAEFKSLYGENPTDLDFVTALYESVLHRTPDEKGLADHLAGIEDGMSREQLLFNFAISGENKTNVWPDINEGIWLG
jgi:hypothetical protein